MRGEGPRCAVAGPGYAAWPADAGDSLPLGCGVRHTRVMRKRTKVTAPRTVRRPLPDFTHLPDRVDPADLVTTQQVEPPEDPRGGRDTETEFMLRNAGF